MDRHWRALKEADMQRPSPGGVKHAPPGTTTRGLAMVPVQPTSSLACAGLGELLCPRHDELRKDRGCQVKCEPSSQRCQRGRKVCNSLRGCVRININSDATWSTLKGLVRARGSSDADLLSLPWCAPEVKPPSGPSCQATDPLCIVFALSTTAPDQYTARPASSMPPGVPVVAASLRDYPKRRHVAITHLTYIVDHYDSLPGAVALLFDHGDRHAQSGADVCAQAVHIAEVARAVTGGALNGMSVYKSLSPDPTPQTDIGAASGRHGRHGRPSSLLQGWLHLGDRLGARRGSSRRLSSRSRVGAAWAAAIANATSGRASPLRSFYCVRHTLNPAEREAWTSLLKDTLGPPPRSLMAYAGRGELLATRAAIRRVPRATYAALLHTLLSRSSPHADPTNTLMPRLWGALFGGAYGAGASGGTRHDGFVCDHAHGWGRPRAAAPPSPPSTLAHADAPTRPWAVPQLRHASIRTHDDAGAAAALARVPSTPSSRERASECTPGSLMCIVVAAHKEDLGWLQRLK